MDPDQALNATRLRLVYGRVTTDVCAMSFARCDVELYRTVACPLGEFATDFGAITMADSRPQIDRAEDFAPARAFPHGWWSRLRARAWRGWTWIVGLVHSSRFWLLVCAATVVILATFTYLWVTTCRVVDARLSGGAIALRSGIYAAPLVIRRGQPLAIGDLVSYLEELGYGSGSSEETEGLNGRFVVDGFVVRIEPLDTKFAAPDRSGPVDVQFLGERGVERVTDARTNTELDQCTLEPLVIASAYNSREKRITVEYDAIPEVLRNAIVTTEDRRFWSHNGIDYRGMARAAEENIRAGEVVQGGSTITQQVVKNVFLSSERTYLRKVKEAWISYVLEWKLDKKQILAMYSNEVYMGQKGRYAIHGFAEASRQYFGKDLSELNLEESALLAGIVCAPSTNSPYRYPERARMRRNLVIDLLVDAKQVQPGNAEAAKAAPLVVLPPENDTSWLEAPYFTDYVQGYIEQAFDDARPPADRYSVSTTIDINLQRAATEAVTRQLEKLDRIFAEGKLHIPAGTLQAALVAVDTRTGAVVAMVGGRNYQASQFNRATDAERQPGSAFKPFVYATALESRRFTLASQVMDAPRTFTYAGGRVYEPDNYGESYSNTEITLRVAFRNSKNVPTVELAMDTGLDEIAKTAERAGLPRPDPYPSMALGVMEATPLEVARAYTAFANGGVLVDPTPVAGTEGEIYLPQSRPRTVLTPQTAYLMTNVMQDVIARGTGRSVRALGVTGAVAGKTGTSRDGWFVGYTPNLVCVVWVGFDDNSQLGLTGAQSALPIWADFMKQAVAFRPELGGETFAEPAGITHVKICSVSGARAGDYCSVTHDEVFVAGTESLNTCTLHTAEGTEGTLLDEYGNPVGVIEPADGSEAPDGEAPAPSEPAPQQLRPLDMPLTYPTPDSRRGRQRTRGKRGADINRTIPNPDAADSPPSGEPPPQVRPLPLPSDKPPASSPSDTPQAPEKPNAHTNSSQFAPPTPESAPPMSRWFRAR